MFRLYIDNFLFEKPLENQSLEEDQFLPDSFGPVDVVGHFLLKVSCAQQI